MPPLLPPSPASARQPATLIEDDPGLPVAEEVPRGRRRPDPLAEVWDREIVPILKSAPGIRAIAVLEEIRRSIPGSVPAFGTRWSGACARGERWSGPSRMRSSARSTSPAVLVCQTSPDTSALGVTVAGVVLGHRLYHFRLAF